MAGCGVVVVGAGQGGFQAAASLRDAGFDGAVMVIGEEPGLPYQRPPLSKAYLTGKVGPDGVRLRAPGFYAQQRIDLLPGERVDRIDRARHRIGLASGAEIDYEHLVLATGARVRMLAAPGQDADGVIQLRTLADAQQLRSRLHDAREIVVVGAGFIGLEVAAAAATLGPRVHVLEATGRPLARAVSVETSRFFAGAHLAWGTRFSFGVNVTRIVVSQGKAVGLDLADGSRIPADLILLGVGVQPNVELASEAGLAVANGIVVDENLSTADPAISAIGDCASFPAPSGTGRQRLESVQNAVDQARCVASRLVGRAVPYAKVPWFWSDQRELRLQIAGITADHDTAIVRGDPAKARFSVFCFRNGRLLGVESVNQPSDHMAGRKLLERRLALTPGQARDEEFNLAAHVAAAIT